MASDLMRGMVLRTDGWNRKGQTGMFRGRGEAGFIY